MRKHRAFFVWKDFSPTGACRSGFAAHCDSRRYREAAGANPSRATKTTRKRTQNAPLVINQGAISLSGDRWTARYGGVIAPWPREGLGGGRGGGESAEIFGGVIAAMRRSARGTLRAVVGLRVTDGLWGGHN
jgi:hypothetical protein